MSADVKPSPEKAPVLAEPEEPWEPPNLVVAGLAFALALAVVFSLWCVITFGERARLWDYLNEISAPQTEVPIQDAGPRDRLISQ